jgi:hypothetical protein
MPTAKPSYVDGQLRQRPYLRGRLPSAQPILCLRLNLTDGLIDKLPSSSYADSPTKTRRP